MRNYLPYSLLMLSILVLGMPAISHAQATNAQYSFDRDGIFGCSAGEYAPPSVGARAAVGGAYVPVNDAAVTVNTYMILYKECVLREVINRQKENAIAEQVARMQAAVQTGRNGNPLYATNVLQETQNAESRAVLNLFQANYFDTVNPAIRQPVQRALIQGYTRTIQQSNTALGCSYQGDLSAALSGRPTSAYGALTAFMQGGCDTISAYNLANAHLTNAIVATRNCLEQQWDWGRGYWSVLENPENPCSEIRTPSALIQESHGQALGAGFDMQKNANDVGQMVSALFSNLNTQIISDNRGLSGLTQSTGGQPSYLDRLVADSRQGVIGAAVNAALQILRASQQIEVTYHETMSAIAGVLAGTIGELRASENQCWSLIIDAVCANTPTAPNYTCTAKPQNCTTNPDTGASSCPPSGTLRIATSTYQFAQPIITAQITPLATTTLQNIQISETALGLLQELITMVTNTASVNTQRLALEQLDQLVAERRLHTQFDVTEAQERQGNITQAMANLVEDTQNAWGDSTNTNIGWCNINNQSVIQMWIDRWRQ